MSDSGWVLVAGVAEDWEGLLGEKIGANFQGQPLGGWRG